MITCTNHQQAVRGCIGEAAVLSGRTIHQLFEEHARRAPGRIAAVCGDEALTYGELDARANQVAWQVRHRYAAHTGRPLAPDTLVALLLDRRVDMLVGILGALKAGAAWLPLDPRLPPERMRYILKDAQCRIALTHSHLLESVSRSSRVEDVSQGVEAGPSLIAIDAGPARKEFMDQPPPITKATDLAYVMYTSGTTGKPKGVMIEHRGIENMARSIQDELAIMETSVVLQFSPITFDASVAEIFIALTCGARLVIADDEARRDPLALVELIRTQSVSLALVLPSLLARIAINGVPELPSLATLVVVGEPCTRDVMLAWGAGRRLINGYGPTEATIWSTVHAYASGDSPSSLGRPILNTRLYVLDHALAPVPAQTTGELYISGVGLARGYLNAPALTRERFIENPFADASDHAMGYGRLYKTGDLVRRSDEGTLEYIGRNDFQVKIRGYRIELGEIENALLGIAGVKQVCAVARTRVVESAFARPPGSPASASPASEETFLVVYYVAPQEIDPAVFSGRLARTLPEYMVPSCFVWMQSFPLTPNDKVDRQALPDPELGSNTRTYVAPRTKREAELSEIWKTTLGVNRVGVEDDFFHIGGSSFLAITLASAISEKLGTKMSVSQIYCYRTIAQQAEFLTGSGGQLLEPSPISAFRAQGERLPLFFVHSSMTGAEMYRKMLAWLDPNQPFYGIESYNCNHLDRPETDLRALAKRYASYIRAVRPHGPYLLGGYSAGANIAYELAHQLVAAGEQVPRLYVIDSLLLDPSARRGGISMRDAEDFLEYFHLAGSGDKVLRRLAQAEMSLLFGYEPRAKLDAKVVLIKATKLIAPLDRLRGDHVARYMFQMEQPLSGWDRHAREVDLCEMDANHETIMEPAHLEQVTRIIQQDIHDELAKTSGVRSQLAGEHHCKL